MRTLTKTSVALVLAAMVAMPMSANVAAQNTSGDVLTTVVGSAPADLEGLPEGPEVEGFISARNSDKMQVTTPGGTNTVVTISSGTEIRAKGGFLGLSRDRLTSEALLNGLPVTVKTVRWNNGLVATRVAVSNKDLKTAEMIRTGTNQRFSQNEQMIGENAEGITANAAATEALRGRVANIDQYNIKGTTNVYFDTGKWRLTPAAQQELCEAASEAEGLDNALLLVVGYTDSVGNEDYNQVLSERRAGKVVNHLQQKCSWAPWRMLTPTGMAESDPLADNSTAEGRAQNRRVSVNILVSKAVDES